MLGLAGNTVLDNIDYLSWRKKHVELGSISVVYKQLFLVRFASQQFYFLTVAVFNSRLNFELLGGTINFTEKALDTGSASGRTSQVQPHT